MKPEETSLAATLSENKSALITRWLEQTLQTYPDPSVKFFSHPQDPFRNPVGYTLKEGLSVLYDGLVQSSSASAMQAPLESIIRIRAVQDISASRAVAFIFQLKRIVRTELPGDCIRFPDELAALEVRIDELTLLAFDLFMKCREQIFEIKANESMRMAFLGEKIRLKGKANPVNDTR